MKYIDIEKLKEEIERRRKFHHDAVIKFCNNFTISFTHSAGLKEDEELLSLIDSLQQEQPEVDLERDAVLFCFDKGLNVTPYQAKTIAHHFYELGLNARKED